MRKENRLRQIIKEEIDKILFESIYDQTATPLVTHGDRFRELGVNPLRTDIGGHSSRDEVLQPSTYDKNGENFTGEHIFVTDNKFIIYKVKNFANPDVKSTKSFFGDSFVELRKAIDTLNGAAKRNGKTLSYRTISPETQKSKVEASSYMYQTFWEYSFDGGKTWYVLIPKPTQNMKLSKF